MKQIIPTGGPKPKPAFATNADVAVRDALQHAHAAAVVAHGAIDDALRATLKQMVAAGRFTCVECGRVFKTPSQFRYNAEHNPVCRRRCRRARHATDLG